MILVCSPNVLPSKRDFHPGRRGNSFGFLPPSLHLITAGEKEVVFSLRLKHYCVFVNACVYLCVSEVSDSRAVGPHGLSETDRISMSLAAGLYSSIREI